MHAKLMVSYSKREADNKVYKLNTNLYTKYNPYNIKYTAWYSFCMCWTYQSVAIRISSVSMSDAASCFWARPKLFTWLKGNPKTLLQPCSTARAKLYFWRRRKQQLSINHRLICDEEMEAKNEWHGLESEAWFPKTVCLNYTQIYNVLIFINMCMHLWMYWYVYSCVKKAFGNANVNYTIIAFCVLVIPQSSNKPIFAKQKTWHFRQMPVIRQ